MKIEKLSLLIRGFTANYKSRKIMKCSILIVIEFLIQQ